MTDVDNCRFLSFSFTFRFFFFFDFRELLERLLDRFLERLFFFCVRFRSFFDFSLVFSEEELRERARFLWQERRSGCERLRLRDRDCDFLCDRPRDLRRELLENSFSRANSFGTPFWSQSPDFVSTSLTLFRKSINPRKFIARQSCLSACTPSRSPSRLRIEQAMSPQYVHFSSPNMSRTCFRHLLYVPDRSIGELERFLFEDVERLLLDDLERLVFGDLERLRFDRGLRFRDEQLRRLELWRGLAWPAFVIFFWSALTFSSVFTYPS